MKTAFVDKIKLTTLLLCISVAVFANQQEEVVLDWLDRYGLRDENIVLIDWTERAPLLADTYVHGCRLESLVDQQAFDVYFDSDGVLLDEQALGRMGVLPKTWEYVDGVVSAQVGEALMRPKAMHIPARQRPDIPVYALKAIDHEQLFHEDWLRETNAVNSLMRYGVNRSLETPIVLSGNQYSEGTLETYADGSWQWDIQIQSSGAVGIRLGFEHIQTDPAVSLYVYSVETPEVYFGPYESGDLIWTPTIMGSRVGIVCYGGNVTLLENVALEIDQIIHVYRSPLFTEKDIQECHIDIACRPEWAGYAQAVGRLGIVDFDTWACSGALIVAPGYTDNPPFLLTANHCVSLQAQATTLEVWWRYQRDTCNDELPPNMDELPRSLGGATLLAGAPASSGSDFTLLLLNEVLPFAATYLGYTTRPIAVDESVVCIHHPQGIEKKISFGNISNAGSPRLAGEPLTSREYFHEVLWTEGTTEGGSSGSPLLLLDSGQLVGQLYGGYASCDAVDEPDYFGRIDVAWPIMAPWLTGEYPIEGEAEGELEGEAMEGEPGPQEGECEGEAEGESEGEEEGDVEADRCFFGLFRCPDDALERRLLLYAEIGCKIILSFLGLLLLRYLLFRSGM